MKSVFYERQQRRRCSRAGLRVGQHRVGHRCRCHDRIKGTQPPSTLSAAQPRHASMSTAFKADKDAKVIQIVVEDPAKTMQIGASLDPK
jgi:hypothetical protein